MGTLLKKTCHILKRPTFEALNTLNVLRGDEDGDLMLNRTALC